MLSACRHLSPRIATAGRDQDTRYIDDHGWLVLDWGVSGARQVLDKWSSLTTCYLAEDFVKLFGYKQNSNQWPILRRWDVPWEWQTVVLTMVGCGVSFVLTGLVEQSVLAYVGFIAVEATIDEKAEILFLGQLSVTAVALGVIYGITNTFRLFPDDIFRYDIKEPFKLRNGWLLWAGIDLFGAITSIALAGAVMTSLNGEPPEKETDSLVLLLPLIASSSLSTAFLVGITGVLAPLLEETVFRGFLMVFDKILAWSRGGFSPGGAGLEGFHKLLKANYMGHVTEESLQQMGVANSVSLLRFEKKDILKAIILVQSVTMLVLPSLRRCSQFCCHRNIRFLYVLGSLKNRDHEKLVDYNAFHVIVVRREKLGLHHIVLKWFASELHLTKGLSLYLRWEYSTTLLLPPELSRRENSAAKQWDPGIMRLILMCMKSEIAAELLLSQCSFTQGLQFFVFMATRHTKALSDDMVPAFDVLGKKSFFLGAIGNGAMMKLVVNMVMGSMMNVFSEGLCWANKSGLSSQTLPDVLDLGGIASPMFKMKGPSMLQGNDNPAFPLKHQQKDMRLALSMGDENAVSMPVAAAANEAFKKARNLGVFCVQRRYMYYSCHTLAWGQASSCGAGSVTYALKKKIGMRKLTSGASKRVCRVRELSGGPLAVSCARGVIFPGLVIGRLWRK